MYLLHTTKVTGSDNPAIRMRFFTAALVPNAKSLSPSVSNRSIAFRVWYPISVHPLNVHPLNVHPVTVHPVTVHPVTVHPMAGAGSPPGCPPACPVTRSHTNVRCSGVLSRGGDSNEV